jgi:hypothetical protein
MRWTKNAILQKLRQLHRAGKDLAYTRLARKEQRLLSAAAYHFGSYRAAVARAGVDYGQILRRPFWTRQRVISLIKAARRKEIDLNWAAVTARGDELARAAFASLQKRLFGSWARALHAAGLHADEVNLYHSWDRHTVAYELRARLADGESVASGAVQRENPALHAAAIRYFVDYDRALRAARINPWNVRLRARKKPRKSARR